MQNLTQAVGNRPYRKSKPPFPTFAALVMRRASPSVSSRERGSGVCSASKQARTARRATWTKPGRSPPAGRCRCSWPIFICIERGSSEGETERRRDGERRMDRETRRVRDKEMALMLVSPHLLVSQSPLLRTRGNRLSTTLPQPDDWSKSTAMVGGWENSKTRKKLCCRVADSLEGL